MILVKHEKLERAANFARVMKELTMLGAFIRLADYLFVEGGLGVNFFLTLNKNKNTQTPKTLNPKTVIHTPNPPASNLNPS